MDPATALNRAAAALNAGRLHDAERCCRDVLSADPGSAVSLQLLGLIAHRRQRFAEAIGFLSASIQIEPAHAAWHFNLGVSCRAAGDAPAAERAYTRALQLDPDHVSAHYNRGSVLLDMGRPDQALACFQTVLRLDPDHGNACFRAGTIHRQAGDIGRAAAFLRRAAQALPGDTEVRLTLGVVLIDAGKLDEARELFEGLVNEQPDLPEAVLGLAGIDERSGDPEKAWERVEPLLDHERLGTDAALLLADLATKVGREDQAIDALEAAMSRTQPEGERAMLCHFALGRLLDGRGEPDRAFGHFERANGLKPRRYDPAEHERHIDALIEAFRHGPGDVAAVSSLDDTRPIFIVGMPRSGTSLVEQVLASHPQVFGGGELPHVSNLAGRLRQLAPGDGYPDTISASQLDEMARVYLAQLDKIDRQAARITDKAPGNFLYVGLIARMLPGARIVHCRRDPLATCWSCFSKNFVGAHAYSYGLADLGHYYIQCQRLMAHWRQAPGGRMFELEYERLVRYPEHTMRELVAFCGLDWSDACLRFHENPRRMPSASYDQVRRPIYTDAIDHWRRYEGHLGPLRDALGRPAA
jgi:tetratricopeptide (TPR) repeat protein